MKVGVEKKWRPQLIQRQFNRKENFCDAELQAKVKAVSKIV